MQNYANLIETYKSSDIDIYTIKPDLPKHETILWHACERIPMTTSSSKYVVSSTHSVGCIYEDKIGAGIRCF